MASVTDLVSQLKGEYGQKAAKYLAVSVFNVVFGQSLLVLAHAGFGWSQVQSNVFAVTLYTAEDCPGCDAARVYLRRRGVPYQELVVETVEEAAEMKRRVGTDAVPVMALGRAPTIGFNEPLWSKALDAATYPQQSQLPLTYRAAAPQPMLPRAVGPVSESKPEKTTQRSTQP